MRDQYNLAKNVWDQFFFSVSIRDESKNDALTEPTIQIDMTRKEEEDSEGRKTPIVNNFPKTCRDCEQILHLYHAKTYLIDIRLLWPLITRKKHSRT